MFLIKDIIVAALSCAEKQIINLSLATERLCDMTNDKFMGANRDGLSVCEFPLKLPLPINEDMQSVEIIDVDVTLISFSSH